MKKIAIYGDSFASFYSGWPKFFSHLMKNEVDVFGESGTSVGYSYLKFLETHENYDQVFFFWTHPTRCWLISVENNFDTLKHHCSFMMSKNVDIIFDIHLQHMNLTSNIKEWVINENKFVNLYETKNLLSIIAMRDSVKLKRPDCFNIECFDFYEVNNNKLTSKKTPGMWRIGLQDMSQFSEKTFLRDDPTKRPNHLTFQQNLEFANNLFKFVNDKNFDIHETFKNPQKYYTMSKTIEESGFIL